MPAPPPYRIELTRAAARDLRALPRDALRRIDRAIQALADEPRPHGAKKLRGSEKTYRVRVGDYRVLYDIEDRVLLLLVVRIAHRREAH